MEKLEEAEQARIEYLSFLRNSYNDFLESLASGENKYRFPVVMGLCTYKEVKAMSYKEFLEIHRTAFLKLEKEKVELELITGIIRYGR